jgi:hypothetical protein
MKNKLITILGSLIAIFVVGVFVSAQTIGPGATWFYTRGLLKPIQTVTQVLIGGTATTTNADLEIQGSIGLNGTAITTWPIGENFWSDSGTALSPVTTTRYVGIGTSTIDSVLTLRKPDMFDSVWCYYSGVATDRTSVANTSAGTAFNVGSAVGEYTWLGKNDQFSEIYINVSTAGSDIAYTWEYSKGGDTWDTLTVTPSTVGVDRWRADGTLTFTPPVDWATDTVNGYTGYIVRASPISAVTTRPTALTIVPSNDPVLNIYANAGDTVGALSINEQGNVGINIAPNNAYRFYVSGNTAFSGSTVNSGAFSQYTASIGTTRTAGITTYANTASTVSVPVQYSPLFAQRGRAWETGTTTDVAYLQSTTTATYETAPADVSFSPDGLQMYVLGDTGNDITYYTLSSAWDISTASYVSQFQVGTPTGETNPSGMYFKPDGLKFWMVGYLTDKVYQFSMSSSWDMSSASYDSVSFSVDTQEATPAAIYFRPDGKQMYVMGTTGDDVNIYNLSTAWDITTAVYSTVFSVAGQESGPNGLFFSSDGYRMYVIGTTGDDVNVYRLGVAWDVTTAVYRVNYSISAEANPTGVYWRADGLKMYTIGSTLDAVREYDVVVPWELNTVAVDTFASFYSQVKPASGNPITALREDGFWYGASEYRPLWNWLSDGKVGFGTSTPAYRLSVQSDSATEDLFQVGTTTNNNIFTIDKNGDSYFTNPPTVSPLRVYDEDNQLVDKFYVDLAVTALGSRYYMFDDADTGGTDYKLTSLVSDGADQSYATTSVVDGQYIMGWVSPVSSTIPKLIAGVYDWHIFANQSGGTGKKNLRLYWTLVERKADTTEVVIATSSMSGILTDSIAEEEIHLNLADDYTLASTSRVVGKIYAEVSGVGGDPDVTLYYEGNYDSHWEIPTNLEILTNQFVPYTGANANVDLGAYDLTVGGTTNLGGIQAEIDGGDYQFVFNNSGFEVNTPISYLDISDNVILFATGQLDIQGVGGELTSLNNYGDFYVIGADNVEIDSATTSISGLLGLNGNYISDWSEIQGTNYWTDDGTTLTPATSTRNVSTTGYVSGGLNSVFGSATEYLTIGSRDLVGGGLFNAPLLQFTNSNAIGQSTKIGVIDNGLYISDADNGQPTIGLFGATENEPYGLMQYSTSTQSLRLNTYQNDATQEYFDFGKTVINGYNYPLITGTGNEGIDNILAIKNALVLTGESPYIGFWDEDDESFNIMSMTADGLLSLGGISAALGATSTETGLKEVINVSGAFIGANPATETCTVYKDSYNETGFARNARMGAVCGIKNTIGDNWVGGVSINAFSTSTGATTPIQVANFKPTETIISTDLDLSGLDLRFSTTTYGGGDKPYLQSDGQNILVSDYITLLDTGTGYPGFAFSSSSYENYLYMDSNDGVFYFEGEGFNFNNDIVAGGDLSITGTTTLNNVTTSCGTLGTDATGAIVCNDLGGMFGSDNRIAMLEARIAELESKQSFILKIINLIKSLWTKN